MSPGSLNNSLKRYLQLALVLLSLCLIAPSWGQSGADGTARLERFFKDVHTLRAHFEQQVYNAQSELVQNASGQVVIQRPGHFRWDYAKPYHQLIVADGKTLWVYDADLSQVTVKPLATLLKDTPALLLSSDASLKDTFRIKDLGTKEGLAWVELLPKTKASSFKQLRLAFDDKGPRMMELTDNFDQVTQLSFDHLALNPSVDPQVFRFEPPPGVDVIKE